MLLGVAAVYVPIPSARGDNTLIGLDFFQLHFHRIRFAQEALFGPHPHLPAWYPRELLGTPFWSNVQSFPFLPTRLILVAWDPLLIYAAAVNLAAALAAVFTFLYARRLGLSRAAAGAAGWTFACAGFYASRVLAGHLPLLEVYAALPLVLWLIERCRAADAGTTMGWRSLLPLGAACACLALAGHPQIPAYALAAGVLFTLYRLGGRAAARVIATMATGVGTAGFVLWPMWLLILRSTRVLPLDPPDNDIAFPYRRLIAFFLPWSQGWPGAVARTGRMTVAFPNDAHFWETVCYIGWLPLAAALFLLIRAVVRRKRPSGPWRFIVATAALGLLLALPAARAPFAHLPGTFFRSPARLLYFTAFGLALGLGAAIDVVLTWATAQPRRWWAGGLVAIAILGHLLDLGHHDRQFIRMGTYRITPTESDERIAQAVGDGRVAIDSGLWTPLNRELDDIGYFDSIALARSYRALLDLGEQPPQLNVQYLNGSDLNARALAACGVRFMATTKFSGNSATPDEPAGIRVAWVRDPAPRVAFYPLNAALFLDADAIHRDLRDPTFDLSRWLMLPRDESTLAQARATSASGGTTQISYQRDSEDEVTCNIKASQDGFLRWLETCDPGWHATTDGAPARILPADDVFMAIRVPAGPHNIRLTFSTPGAATGGVISIVSLLGLVAVAFWPFRRSPAEQP